jgi:hypothetical protein
MSIEQTRHRYARFATKTGGGSLATRLDSVVDTVVVATAASSNPSTLCSMEILDEKELRPDQAERRLKKFLFHEAPRHQTPAELLYPLMTLQKALLQTAADAESRRKPVSNSRRP